MLMNAHHFSMLFLFVFITPAFAGEEILTKPANDSPWRFGVGYAHLLGLKTEFRGLGRYVSPNVVQPLGSGLDRDYDNGFVYVDSSGNVGGETWNWAYDDAGQYSAADGGTINYSITNSLANAQVDENGGSHPGVELFAYYHRGVAGFLDKAHQKATWGFRFGLQYSRIDIANGSRLATGLSTTNDRFSLGGSIVPLAPYTGGFSGPGTLLGDNPSRSIALGGVGLVSGSRNLELDLTLFSFGSYLELPVSEEFHLVCESGLSLGAAAGSYRFTSETFIDGLGTQTSRGGNSNMKILPGAYFGVGANYDINNQWAIFSALRFQYMDALSIRAGDSESKISFDSAVVVSFGCSYSF